MQRAGVIFDNFKTFVAKGVPGQAFTLTDNKSEKEEMQPSQAAPTLPVSAPLPKSSSASKLLTLKDILNYEEFDLACANELADLCNSPERWTSSEPPFAYHFLKNKLDIYHQHFECATKINAELDNKLNFDANHIAIKSLLRSRIDSLRKIIIEYQDCLYERSLALGGMVRLETSLQAKIKNSINEFKPTEYFSDAIFVCHSAQWLNTLALAELATMLEKHSQCGVNGVAGAELSKIIIREIINRLVARSIHCFDPQLIRIQSYLFQNIPVLGEQLHIGTSKVVCDLLEAKLLQPVGPALLDFIKISKGWHKTSFNKLCETLRDVTVIRVHTNAMSVFSEEIRQVLLCLNETEYQQQLAKRVVDKAADALFNHGIDVSAQAEELRGLLSYLAVHAKPSFEQLSEAVRDVTWLRVHSNDLSVFSEDLLRAFRLLGETEYHHQLAKSVSAKIINDLYGRKLDINAHSDELRPILHYLEIHETDCFKKVKQVIDEHTNNKANAFRQVYQLLYGIVHHPFKSNYLNNKDALSGEELIKDIDRVGRANPMVTFVWELIQRYYPDITEKNAALFKEIYKAKFNFSYFGLSRVAGSFFWGASENLTRTVDALTDKQISEFRVLEASTCRATIYRGLCKLS